MQEMLQLIQTTGQFESSSRQPKLIAQDWLDEGFDHHSAAAWIDAGCWSPIIARSLHNQGISAAEAGLPG
jgi:hypothetical protein